MAISIFSKIRTKAAEILSPSINKLMYKAIFQFLGNDAPIHYEDNMTSYIKNGYNKNIFVYMCVNYITRNGASIPWKLRKELPDGSFQDVAKHPLIDLMNRPNGLYSFKEYKEQTLGYLLLTGNAISYTVKAGLSGNEVQEVYYLPSDHIDIKASGSWLDPIKSYDFDLFQDVSFDSDEVIHTKLPNYEWDNGQSLYGQSPLKAGLATLEQSNQTTTAMKNQAANQGAKGLLMFDAKMGEGEPTPTQLKNLKTQINSKINGNDKAGSVQVTGKTFKYQQLGAISKDLQLIEGHNVSRQDLCALYGLDSMLFNDHQASSYNNMNEAKKSAYVDAIIPYCQMIVDDWNNNIVRGYDETLSFYLDTSNIDVLQADKKEQAEWLAKAYWIKNQRKQEIMGEKVDTTLSPYYIPSNLIPSDELDINNEMGDYEG